MRKKWLLTLSGSLLAAMIVTGCAADDEDPAPPEDTMEENGDMNTEDPLEETGENVEEGLEEGGELMEEGANEGEEMLEEGADDAEELMEEGNNAGTEEGTEEANQ